MNIPVSAQCRFPILGAFFCGNGKKPSSHVLVEHFHEEFADLATCPISWTDSAGRKKNSFVFLPLVVTDGPAKGDFLSHKYSGTESCIYCTTVGTIVSKADFPACWRETNPFLSSRDRGRTSAIGVKFPALFHEEQPRLRSDAERVEIGRLVLERRIEEDDPSIIIHGIKGTPALSNLPNYRETGSHASDSLHVVAEGIVKKMLEFQINSVGKPHSFRKFQRQGWAYICDLEDTMHRVSEMDRKPASLERFSFFTGSDQMGFLLYKVGLLCCDEDVVQDLIFAEVWCDLADAVFLLHSEDAVQNINAVTRAVETFAESYKACFFATNMTWKVHMFQHFPLLVKQHGPAFLTDAFNFERLLNIMKRDTTATRGISYPPFHCVTLHFSIFFVSVVVSIYSS